MLKALLASVLVLLVPACSQGAGEPDSESEQVGSVDAKAVDATAIDTKEGHWPAGYDDSDCNLQTVLDPNKPGSPGHLIESPRNPNGDSELAVLMRRFVDDLKEARIQVQGGGAVPKLFPVHRTMRCAWPTRPEDRNEGFDTRAIGYLGAVRAFDAEPSKATYNAVINNCVACHQVSCGGVIDFIETLRWQ